MVSSSNVVYGDNEEECATIQKPCEEVVSTGAEYQNMLSRSAIYPISDMQRLQVPDGMVPWQVDFISKFKFSHANKKSNVMTPLHSFRNMKICG